ncbi:hypothetical protein BH10PAT4_BH10PAT4_5310 [soil metagenome]
MMKEQVTQTQILKSFILDGKTVPVNFVEKQQVKDGVLCDIYTFTEDDSCDLGIVTVEAGYKTPLQRILMGDKTVEGFLSGSGTLTVGSTEGKPKLYVFDTSTVHNEVAVEVGQTMQWHATGQDSLVFYEICTPLYDDGRFENLSE